jgi:hypothetical protein
MMASRGMGAINPSKMPGKKVITRTDDPNKVAMYKRGGRVKRMDEGGEAEAEPVKNLNIAPEKKSGPTIQPTHLILDKNFKSAGAKFSSGDVPVGSGTASFNANTSVSAAKGQRAQAMIDQLQADYKHQLDKNTSVGGSLSHSPQGEKRLTIALNKSWAGGGKVGLYDNINAKRKRIAAGSGEKMRKPGSKGAPTKQAFINSAKTAKK